MVISKELAEALKHKHPVSDYMDKIRSLTGWYWAGTYGQIGTDALWSSKSNQTGITDWYARWQSAKAKGIGKRVADCVGVDKYARWVTVSGSVPYDKYTDLNQEMLFDLNKTLGLANGLISTLPEQEGLVVWRQGHMGIYLGNGLVKEAKGGAYGIIVTKLESGSWTHWFVNPFVDYGGTDYMIKKTSPLMSGDNVKQWQTLLNNYAGAKLVADGVYGNLSESAQKVFEQNNGLKVDGIVDYSDYQKMCEVIDVYATKMEVFLKNKDVEILAIKSQLLMTESIVKQKNDEISKLKSEISKLTVDLSNSIAEVDSLSAEISGYKNRSIGIISEELINRIIAEVKKGA